MRVLVLSIALLWGTAAAAADPAVGVWQTQPDRKDLISHIEITACGEALCGVVKRVFDEQGQSVETRSRA